jgi:hypothetical protein
MGEFLHSARWGDVVHPESQDWLYGFGVLE